MLAGALLKGPPPPPMPGIGGYAGALPDPFRHDLGRALRDSRPDWAGMREAYHGRRAALAAVLTAEPFDPGAVATVLQRQTEIMGELSRRGVDMLMVQIARMTPPERAAYAEALRADPGPRPGRRR